MQWIAIFEDHPDRLLLRADLFDAHVEYLRARSNIIRLAGALRSDSDAPWAGGHDPRVVDADRKHCGVVLHP